MNIYYTLKEYQENYIKELNDFLNDYEDNSEIDFWGEQKELYLNCLENVVFLYIDISGEYVTKTQLTGENIIDEIHQKIYGSLIETIGEKDPNDKELKTEVEVFGYNFELAEKLKRSFEKILNFIDNIDNQNDEEGIYENAMFEKLNTIRDSDYSDYELTKLLKELSNNYEIDLLESISKDIDFYLFLEKDKKESEYTSEEVENAIEKRKMNGLEIPYYKRKTIEELTERQKENRKKFKGGALLIDPIIDKEQLLFPFEFYGIYRFKNLVRNAVSKSKPEQSVNKDPSPEIDLSDSNAVQKIIYLNELGIIDLLRKEPCFALSVNNLANVITAITGEKNTTIQPYLNVLINNTGNENNNPYKATSTVNKVKNQLINLGIKSK